MSFIRTVGGDIPPSDLGVCYPHEHLLARPPHGIGADDLTLDSEQAMQRELNWFKQAGGNAIVDMSTPDYGRDAAGLARLYEASGVHIIAATGYNKEKFSESFLMDASVQELSERFVQELEEGMDGTGVRAGLIKASSTLDHISPLAERMFRGAARAHHATGAPISTHTEAGTMAYEQVELLQSEGVRPDRVIIGHMDRKLEWDHHLRVARTGAYLGFDQLSKEKYYPDRLRIEFILRLVSEGFGKQILLSGDMARKTYLPGYGSGGGPGFTYILWRFLPWLRESGLPEDAIQDLVVNNPARALQFAV
jgi:5-phospho-D-xylono-1,4-lactonase